MFKLREICSVVFQKIVATGCQILRLNTPNSISVEGREEPGRKGGIGRGREGREGRGRPEEGASYNDFLATPMFATSLIN